MLYIEIPEREVFNDETSEFVLIKSMALKLEHSLVSLSKWESKWCKPFLSKVEKTDEEIIDYIRCMTITQNVPLEVYTSLPNDILDRINEYIKAPMTATWFSENEEKKNKEIITSEVIYAFMFAQKIPLDCQKWHLNRLLTLLNVCSLKNNPPKKRGRKDLVSRRNAINAARKNQYGTKG